MKGERAAIIIIAAFTVCLFFTGCVGLPHHELPSKNISAYNFTSSIDGLKISVDPFSDEERLKKYFGTDLISRGILPILIEFENINSEDGFYLIKEKTHLAWNESGNIKINVGNIDKEVENAKNLLTITSYSLVAGPLLVALAEFNFATESIVRRNLDDKGLVDKIVYSGMSNKGFLYFWVNKKEEIRFIDKIIFSAKNIRTDEIKLMTVKVTTK